MIDVITIIIITEEIIMIGITTLGTTMKAR